MKKENYQENFSEATQTIKKNFNLNNIQAPELLVDRYCQMITDVRFSSKFLLTFIKTSNLT